MNYFKKVFLMVFLLMMIGGGRSWATTDTIGNTDNTSAFGTAFSDSYSLVKGDVLHYEFTNYSDKAENYHNWLLYITGAVANDFVLRPDNWWFCGESNKDNAGSITATIDATGYDWGNLRNDMDGASVTIDITHNGTTVDVTAVATNNGRTYTETLSLTLATANEDLSVKLSVEKAHIVIGKEKFTSYLTNGYLNSRFEGVGGGTGSWEFDNGYCNKTSGTRTFRIKNLYNGDQVKMAYTGTLDITFSTSNVKTTSGESITSGTAMTSGTTYNISKDGTLELSVTRFQEASNHIQSIEITRYPVDEPTISLTSYSNALLVNESENISFSVLPTTATPSFTSSNTTIATVDVNGRVTALSPGTTTITSSLTVGGVTANPKTYNLKVRSTTTDKYVFDFTGCGSTGQTLEVNGVGGQDYSVINFNRTYGNKTFNYDVGLFALPNSTSLTGDKRVFLHNGGIYNYQDSSQPFYILGLHNGDNIIINYDIISGTQKITSSSIINTTEVVSGEEYTITADGTLALSLGKYNRISSIIIYNDHVDPPSFYWSDDNLTTKFDTSGGGKLLRYDLSTLNFVEPMAVVQPETATYTVRSLNTSVALMSTTTLGDILFVNTGSVNIQGTLKTKGNDYRDTYTVEVWANNANYDERGNTCYMSEIGMLNADRKTVTAIAGIRMEFGSAEDATLIVDDPGGSGKLVAYTINKNNGWRHRYPYNSTASPCVPTNGSFYKFTALTNGTLSFKGVKNGGDNTVVLVDATNLSAPLITIAAATKGYCESTTATLTAGHVYYLYGNVPAEDSTDDTWSAFLLSEFTFVSDFKLLDNRGNETMFGSTTAAATSAADVVTISGVANPVVEIEGYSGDISAATLSVSGGKLQVSGITGTGGAIRIKISDGGTGVRYFTLTVPYGAHVWDLRTGTGAGTNGMTKAEVVSHLKTAAADANLHLSGLTRTYKVSGKTSAGIWTELIDPIIAVNGRVEGDNGFYFDKTSGLIFETRSSGFGVKETQCTYYTVTTNANGHVTYYSSAAAIPDSVKNNDNFTISEAITENLTGDKYSFDNEAQYRLTYEATSEADYIMMRGSSTVIIPGVKAGQYVKIYTYRHSDNKGETYRVKNLIDLDNHTYTTDNSFIYHGILSGDGASGQAIRNCYGAAIFKVPAGYDENNTDISLMPTITMSDDGWVKIYKIEVCDAYSTDMIMSLDRGTYPEFIDMTPDCEYASVVIRDGKAVKHQYSGVAPQIHVENAGTCTFEFEVVDGSIDYSVVDSLDRVYNVAKVTYRGGRGVLKITQREILNGFTVDKHEFYVAVNSINSKTYPYTWDFSSHNMYQGSSSTATNMASLTSGNYGTWTGSEGTFTTTFSTQKPFIDKNSVSQNATTTKVLFAQGSELCAGNNPVVETAGLGVEGRYNTTSIQRSTGGNTFTYNYKTYDLTTPVTIDGSKLTGAGEITIPSVSADMYVFVKGTNLTGLTASNTVAGTGFNAASDVVYLKAESAGDVVLTIPATAQIQKIAVTDVTKNINVLGYATESRAHSIDHTYTGEFTVDDVNAYAIQYGSYDRKKATVTKSAEVQVVPASTGVVLYKANATAACTVPLFHPAVNLELESSASQLSSDASALTGNMMAACVSGKTFTSETEGENTVFIMARTFYTYQKGSGNSGPKTSDVEAFYRMKLGATADNTMTANKAYLLVPTAQLPTSAWDEDAAGGGSARGYLFFAEDLMQLGDATAISRITTDGDNTAEGNGEATAPRAGVWYTLSGQRLQVKPTQSGIYIVNGKKCYIK